MRVLDVSGFTYEIGPTVAEDHKRELQYCQTMETIQEAYDDLIENGANIEDARGILPTNIHTNIIVNFNLRTIAEVLSKRASIRTQGEYRDFLVALYDEIIKVHPWCEIFLRNRKNDAAKALEKHVLDTMEEGIDRTDIIKLIDILRT
jgi:thymidylate synthase ThyX